ERGHPAASLSPSPVQFSNSRVGAAAPPATVSLASVGSASLEVGSVTVGGSNAGDFSKMSDGCSGKSLQPRSSCSVQVQFRPTATGSRNATLLVSDNASDSPQTATIQGVGTEQPTPLTLLIPDPLRFPNTQVRSTASPGSVTVESVGTAPL